MTQLERAKKAETIPKGYLHRSKIYQSMMPDELVEEAFGKLNPSPSERAAFFFERWCDSRNNILKIDRTKANELHSLCKTYGLLPQWDYQIKGMEARFVRAEDLAMIRLGWKNG